MSSNLMQRLAKHIAEAIGKRYGFVLLVFEFGEPNGKDRINYVSNAQRENVVEAMKEFIDKTEGAWGAHKLDIPSKE